MSTRFVSTFEEDVDQHADVEWVSEGNDQRRVGAVLCSDVDRILWLRQKTDPVDRVLDLTQLQGEEKLLIICLILT